MRTRKSLGSGALISIATRRTWRRSMARNMALSACARLRKRANCKARSADAWLNNAEVEAPVFVVESKAPGSQTARPSVSPPAR